MADLYEDQVLLVNFETRVNPLFSNFANVCTECSICVTSYGSLGLPAQKCTQSRMQFGPLDATQLHETVRTLGENIVYVPKISVQDAICVAFDCSNAAYVFPKQLCSNQTGQTTSLGIFYIVPSIPNYSGSIDIDTQWYFMIMLIFIDMLVTAIASKIYRARQNYNHQRRKYFGIEQYTDGDWCPGTVVMQCISKEKPVVDDCVIPSIPLILPYSFNVPSVPLILPYSFDGAGMTDFTAEHLIISALRHASYSDVSLH